MIGQLWSCDSPVLPPSIRSCPADSVRPPPAWRHAGTSGNNNEYIQHYGCPSVNRHHSYDSTEIKSPSIDDTLLDHWFSIENYINNLLTYQLSSLTLFLFPQQSVTYKNKLMAHGKTMVSPAPMHWRYCSHQSMRHCQSNYFMGHAKSTDNLPGLTCRLRPCDKRFCLLSHMLRHSFQPSSKAFRRC